MKKCDKRKSSKLHMIYISFNNVRHPVTKTFTTLHYTQLYFTPLHYICRHFTSSHLNFIQLHFTTLLFGLTPFKFPTAYRTCRFITVFTKSHKCAITKASAVQFCNQIILKYISILFSPLCLDIQNKSFSCSFQYKFRKHNLMFF